MADELTEDEFLKAFQGDDATPPDSVDEPDEPDEGDETDSDEPDDSNEPDESDDSGEDKTASEETKPNKADHAFAELRVKNKQQTELLKNIGNVLGVEDTGNLIEALQDKVINAQAKQQNVDPAFLKRLQSLEQQNQSYVQQELKKTAFLGFQKVKDTFGLENDDLQMFAAELQREGVDPFTQPVNVVNEYKLRKFDDLISRAEERGAKAEAERAKKASEHSTTPNKKQGKKDTGEKKVSTLQELSKFLAEN